MLKSPALRAQIARVLHRHKDADIFRSPLSLNDVRLTPESGHSELDEPAN